MFIIAQLICGGYLSYFNDTTFSFFMFDISLFIMSNTRVRKHQRNDLNSVKEKDKSIEKKL